MASLISRLIDALALIHDIDNYKDECCISGRASMRRDIREVIDDLRGSDDI